MHASGWSVELFAGVLFLTHPSTRWLSFSLFCSSEMCATGKWWDEQLCWLWEAASQSVSNSKVRWRRIVVWCCSVGSQRRLIILILSLCFSLWFMGLLILRQFLFGSSYCRHMGNWWSGRKGGVGIFLHYSILFTDFVWSLSSCASSRHRRVNVFLFLVSLACWIISTVCGVCRMRIGWLSQGMSHHVVRRAISPLWSSLFSRCLTYIFCLCLALAGPAGVGVSLGTSIFAGLPSPIALVSRLACDRRCYVLNYRAISWAKYIFTSNHHGM
jgi:hypothetical protein